jgi:hypothetical protein
MKFAIVAVLAGALLGLTPVAHAGPYAGPHCDPSRRDYDSRMCSEEPVNDPSCTPEGDRDQCMSDWLDYQRQQT